MWRRIIELSPGTMTAPRQQRKMRLAFGLLAALACATAAAAAAQQLASTLIPQSGAIASDIVGALPLVLDAPV